MSIDYIGNGAPTLPVPPRGALYYDQVDGILYGSVPGLGEWFVIGGGSVSPAVPIIEAGSQGVQATSVPAELTITAGAIHMYTVSLYMSCVGTASAGHMMTATLAWTTPVGNWSVPTALHLDGGSHTFVMETFPLIASANTPITMTFAYGGGATNDPFDYSVRIVQMPI